MKEFPKTMYLYAEGDPGEEYFLANEQLGAGFDEGERKLIGVYEFKHAVDVEWTKKVIYHPVGIAGPELEIGSAL